MSLKKFCSALMLSATVLLSGSGNVGLSVYAESGEGINTPPSSNTSVTEVTGDEQRFAVPLPKEPIKVPDVEVRGIYLDPGTVSMNFSEENIATYIQYIEGLKAGNLPDEESMKSINNLEKALAMAQSTDINTLVMDIKTDTGTVAWESEIPAVNELKASVSVRSDDFKDLLTYMKSHNIYSIARIVVFKDSLISQDQPQHAILLKDGEVFYDYAKQSWLNPFDETVWKYTVAICKETALRGFDEIHFDYIRFPENAADYNDKIELAGRNGRPKDEAVSEFLKYAEKELKPYGIKTGAAIFGTTTVSWEDKPEDIGQTWRKIAGKVNRISPMIYPSHYNSGYFEIPVPDAEPFKFIEASTRQSLERNGTVKNPAQYTPWIQAFTAEWVEGHIEYTPEVIRKQIDALNTFGLNTYLVWNAGGTYRPETFIKEKVPSEITEGMDSIGRTRADAVLRFFEGLKDENFINTYIMTPVDERPEDYNTYKANLIGQKFRLVDFVKPEISQEEYQEITVTYEKDGNSIQADMEVKVILEGGIYKIMVSPEFIDFKKQAQPEVENPATEDPKISESPEEKPAEDEATKAQ